MDDVELLNPNESQSNQEGVKVAIEIDMERGGFLWLLEGTSCQVPLKISLGKTANSAIADFEGHGSEIEMRIWINSLLKLMMS